MRAFVRQRRGYFRVMIIAIVSTGSGGQASAVNLPPGASVVVNAGDTVTNWNLDAANLTVTPGGQTLNIFTTAGSTVNLDGATVSATALRALVLTESRSIITNSTLISTGNTGLSVIRGLDDSVPGSTAIVTNSVITAAGRGLNVSGGSTATVVNSQITGSGVVGGSIAGDGLGVSLVGGEAILQGSQVIGSNRAAGLFSNGASTVTPHLALDGATLTSGTGSAILVGSLGGPPMVANIEVRNGSSLVAANGVILEVGLPSAPAGSTTGAVFTVDNSQLNGDVQVLAGATTDVVMLNAATLTGNLTNISSLDMNASSITGNLSEPAGSTTVVSLANGAAFTGSMSNIGSLSLDNSSLTGAVTSVTGSTTAIAMTNAASLFGTVTNAQSMNVASGATFDMVDDSTVGALTLGGGTVSLGAGNGAFRTLTATSLNGSGSFSLRTDLAGHLSDLVNVTGTADGDFVLAVQNSGADPIQEAYAQKVVQTGGGPASFAVLGGQVDAGTFVYRLEQRGTDWFLVQAQTDDGGADGGDSGGGEPIISPGARTVIGLFSAAPTVWYGELSTLRSRMGELRNGHEQRGFWARSYGNKYEVSAQDQVHYEQTQQGISFGADTPVSSTDGQWLVGVMGGYSDSQLNMRLGSNGRVDSYYLGLYSTWLSGEGYYIDAVLKANRFQNRADVRMSDGNKTKGDYDSYGVGGSLEMGKHIDMSDGWFIEPYAQVSALWVTGENYRLDNGLEARSNTADSFLGKVGTHIGRTIELPSGGFAQPYVKLAAAHEFASNNEVKVNRNTFSDDLSGSRGELGAGIVAQLSEVLQVHADIDYSNGKNMDQPWGVNVGLRYTW